MRLSVTLAYITLAAASTVRPATSSSVEENTHFSDKSVIEERWGAVKSLLDKPSQIADTLNEKLDSLSASVHTWWNGLQNTGESFWDEVVEIGPNIQRYTDELFHHAMELYPSEKIMEFRESVDNVTSTATALHQVVFAAAEQSGRLLDVSILEELEGVFSVIFEELKELFPPPEEAPGHENRTVMISTVLDRIEEIFLQVAIMHGGEEELLASYSSPLKFGVQHISVTIGDLVEQHPDLANALLIIAIAPLLPQIAASLFPEVGLLLEESWILRGVLRMIGFGPQGPIKGSAAAWLQSWLGSIIPKGSLFSVLQRLSMTVAKP